MLPGSAGDYISTRATDGSWQIAGHGLVDIAGDVENISLPGAIYSSSFFSLANFVSQSIDPMAVGGAHGLAVNDFTGDAHSDILWQNADSAISTWTTGADGHQFEQGTVNFQADPSLKILETLDLNGDGLTDYAVRSAVGQVSTEISTGSGFVDGGTSFTVVPASWRIAGAGNLTTDKYEDLLWQTSDGQLSEWTSNGYSFDESAWTHASPGVSWLVEGLADFNRDGHADILWRNTDGSVAVWTNYGSGNMFNEAAFYQPGVPTSWHIDAVGDVTGDGKDDIIWRNDDGALSLWQANGAAFDEDVYHAQIDTSWHIAQAADFNSDGKADLLWRNDNGAVSTWLSNGQGFDQGVYNSSAPNSWSIVAHAFVL